MFLIDTNICIYALNGREPEVSKKFLAIAPDEIFISSVTVSELEYGAAKSRWSERTRSNMNRFLSNFRTVPFDEKDAVVLGRLRAMLDHAGTPIGAFDAMIASQSLRRGLTVVTHNTKKFARVPNLKIEDWTE